MRVIGRAGVGVDNVDVPAATKRGIIVANAPQSNVDRRGRAHRRDDARARAQHPAGARGARRRPLGALEVLRHEVYEKTLGILGFGRIGQLVAERAQ